MRNALSADVLYACKGAGVLSLFLFLSPSLFLSHPSLSFPLSFPLSDPAKERERKREREGGRERKRKMEGELSRIVFIFKRNDGCLGTF